MMAKKEMKRLARRSLAMFMTLVMTISMLQLQVFAAESFKDQTMDGWYVTEDGVVTSKVTQEEFTEDEDLGFKLSKTISKQTGKDAFEITLTVQTSQTVTTSDAAVQLVIDTSNSMNNCSENCGSMRCGHPNRLEAIQNILTKEGGFLDTLAGPTNTGAVYVSVIYFNAGAGTMMDGKWVNIKTADGMAAAKTAVNTLPRNSGTNIEAGLMLARNRLGMSAVASASSKYTILLSDGEANRTASESTSNTSISGSKSGDATARAAKMAAEVAKISSVYAVGYGVQKSYLESIVGEGEHVLVGEDSATVSAAFANIAGAAVDGMNGSGTAVTDPMGTNGGQFTMGQFIVLGDVSGLADKGVTSSNGTLTWELNPEKAKKETVGDTTTYTYSITYPVTLNTAAEGFKEFNEDGSIKYYPTNGYTYLSVPTGNGEFKEIPFNVPGVCGEIPEVPWTVEYYLQDADSIGSTPTYSKDETKRSPQIYADIWTSVNAPEGYENEYVDDGYYSVGGDLILEIRPDRENVMKLYYNILTSQVTVNHFYKTDRILSDGTEVAGEYTEIPQLISVATEKVGNEYEATPELIYDQGTYELEESNPDKGEITVVEDTASNVINMYYTRLVDERAITSAQVKHVYTTYGYELQGGKYVKVELGSVEEIAEEATEIRATSIFDVSDQPKEGKIGFVLNENLGDYQALKDNGMKFIVDADASKNSRTLYFDKVNDNRGQPIDVTVKHYYTKVVTEVLEDGTVDGPKKVVDNVLGNEDIFEDAYYVGESFAAVEKKDYNDDIYNSDITNADALEAVQLTGDTVIELHYNLTVEPETTKVKIIHHYRTYTTVITETIDAETGEVTGYTESEQVMTDIDVGDESGVLFVGESFEAAIKGREGFDFNEDDSDSLVVKATKIPAEINLYYDKFETDDNREDAKISVQHNYYVDMETIVDGQPGIRRQSEGSKTEIFGKLKAGETFTAAPNTQSDLYKVESSDPLTVVLQHGANTTIKINYIRKDSNLKPVDYTVDYVYNTYKMYVDEDGVAKYPKTPYTEFGERVIGSGYEGQNVTLDPKSNGFTAVEGNPAAAQVLDAEGNAWTFVYEKYIPLETGSVTVNHHYSIETIAKNGTSSWTNSSVLGVPEKMYLGESFTAEPDDESGYVKMDAILDTAAFADPYTLTVSGDHVVDFHYKLVVDNSEEVPYSITHKYYLYDWDETLISGPAEDLEPSDTGYGYVTTTISATPNAMGYTLIDATHNGTDLGELEGSAYTITLQEKRNDVVFVYEKYLAPDLLDVTVIHNYYRDEDAMTNGDDPLARTGVTATGIPEGKCYVAQILNKDGYTFKNAQPAQDIIVSDDVDENGKSVNVIIMNYVRASAKYQVVHIYNCNGNEEGRTTETLSGLHGDVIEADEIARVTKYNGKTYTFQSISDDITLDADEIQTITLVYNRKTGGNIKPEPPKPEPPVIEIPEEDVPLVDIPEVEIPVTDLPEEDIPLADVPKTGETMIYRIMAAISGITLMALAVTGRKKEEEEMA